MKEGRASRLTHSPPLLLVALSLLLALDAAPPSRVSAQARPLAIHEIQGPGPRSPFEGQLVTTSGVVTARRTNGVFIQPPNDAGDGDRRTSEGVFVFTGTTPAASLTAGALVQVTGRVIEFVPAADPRSPPLTELGENPLIELRGFGARLPDAVQITAAMASLSSGHETLEPLEGMRVRVASLTLVSPTLGTVTESTGAASSNGVFYGVITGVPRPFREPGVDARTGLPAGAPCCVPLFDGNPERLRVDSDGQPGAAPMDLPTGTVLRDVVGPLDYAFRTYTILPDVGTPPRVVLEPTGPSPLRAPMPVEITVASLNVQRFFDTTDEPGVSDVVLTAAAFQLRLSRLTQYVHRVLHLPDILGVQEVENLSTLRAIAASLNLEAVGGGSSNPDYEAFLEPGNDPGGINVGVLVKRARVEVLDHRQEGKFTPFVSPTTGRTELLNDRPPFVLVARAPVLAGRRAVLTVIVNHMRSLLDIESPTDGARVRAKRAEQAEYLADLVQQLQRESGRLIVVGDLNAFDVNDGLVDVVGTIRGSPVRSDAVVRATSDRVDPNLVSLLGLLPARERYSYVFDGSAQTLDHALVSSALVPDVTGFAFARGNADAPEVWRTDPRRVGRVSDHDGLLVYLRLGSR